MPIDPEGLAAFSSAVSHVNMSARTAIAQADLLAALLADEAPPGFDHHLRAFYDQTAVETLSDIARSGLIGYGHLAAGARRLLPPDHETRIWLDERA